MMFPHLVTTVKNSCGQGVMTILVNFASLATLATLASLVVKLVKPIILMGEVGTMSQRNLVS